MKCIVLAGGAGNRLWPLSRKNYPKQFVNLKNGHSLFQETIVRNMPFCDEFWIFTSAAYRTIVEGQLQPIQGVMYRCFCEEEPHKNRAGAGAGGPAGPKRGRSFGGFHR